MAKITFNNRQSPFFDALRSKIDNYFEEHKISPTGNMKLWSKTIILAIAAVTVYLLLVFTHLPIAAQLGLCAVLGFNLASIGFNVMHDGAHGSYSKNKHLNNIMSYSLNIMGGSSFMWKIKHNVIHHSFTNIEGVDDDIMVGPLMRINEQQKKYWIHRFQHIYWVLLYGLTYFVWIFWNDFQKYFTHKIGPTPIRKMKLSEHIGFWLTKIGYLTFFIILPAYNHGILATLAGYAVVLFVTGLVIAVIFQLAHVVEDTKFPAPDPTSNKIENEWALHQIYTTANFATNSKTISWFMGGLNFQVEHHLFPKISHIHYPQISKLVRETCQEFNVQYIEYPTIWSAIGAHLRHLRQLGRA
ncbi:MAG TPA: acyl-CoA desaturase [Bacteroidia bacterium]|jgi:linoleoyl-CoA desaturase|nr:acyl-CoA desaturase [Bacteroidia bacterium]HQF29358.1 acyl-CoA desaturase [Bacteroidia bacterium]